ncbi:acyl-CoA dehydrogenase family protein [Stackebrandtia nassauensis]|uniref:Acyl-CoA dehydrogenase domain protein n=1 Tax=Stackebrandtia nassauensis (strain DSM 44728 / CIP 108903 / NRRL B-16338 / NBRC 102104 / LLR-40K-21) TaxID=446470 RepID=D3Q0W0_STANL|nr:acyl-CoA dehydrogenase [Stackebrandtia nassauensis]ADD43710.1 acyl-CoA dehydrogenase domain protein [Stackebrandtia nassauensis DSM 44728]
MTTLMTATSSLPSLFDELCLGRIRWDLLRPFPIQGATDRAHGEAVTGELNRVLAKYGEPHHTDTSALITKELLCDLAAPELLGPRPAETELSDTNLFRLLETAADWTPALGTATAVNRLLGAWSYLPLTQDGRLREFILANTPGRVGAGADTDLSGAGSRLRSVTATPVDDGSAFLLNGTKAFVTNAPIADIIDVSATVVDDAQPRVVLFFLTTDTPGVEIGHRHDLTGPDGLPNGMVRLTDVRVPREHILGDADLGWQSIPDLTSLMVRARFFVVSAPSLSLIKHCVRSAAEFAARRLVDQVPLVEYDYIEHLLAGIGAERFAAQSLVDWCTLATGRANTIPEQRVAKNLMSMACWRVADQATSIMGAQGVETAAGKRDRGAPAAGSVEHALRTARAMRVAGGVDFLVDYLAGCAGVFPLHYDAAQPVGSSTVIPADLPDPLRGHAEFLTWEVHRFAERARAFVRRYPDPAQLHERQAIPILMNRIASELLAMVLTVARAGDPGTDPLPVDLANTYCARARRRIADAFRELNDGTPPGRRRIVRELLKGVSK